MKAPFRIRLISLLNLFLAYFGFRFVTQAGQGMAAVQNDGYAVTGGAMILVAGMLEGYIIGKGYSFRRNPKRKDIKKASDTNFAELSDFAKKISGKK